MGLDHIERLVFEAHIFLKPLYLELFAKVTLLKNSPTSGEFFNKVRRVF